MFRLTISTGNDAFADREGLPPGTGAKLELGRLLGDIGGTMLGLEAATAGRIRDLNGNTVGDWSLDLTGDEAPPREPDGVPQPPWPIGADNGKREGWRQFFLGRSRESCPFPPARADLLRDYREGWDAADRSRGTAPSVEVIRDLILHHALTISGEKVTPREAVTAAEAIHAAYLKLNRGG